ITVPPELVDTVAVTFCGWLAVSCAADSEPSGSTMPCRVAVEGPPPTPELPGPLSGAPVLGAGALGGGAGKGGLNNSVAGLAEPPATRTSPSRRRTAAWPDRGRFKLLVAAQVRAFGSYSSLLARSAPDESLPPATRTAPLGSTVAE